MRKLKGAASMKKYSGNIVRNAASFAARNRAQSVIAVTGFFITALIITIILMAVHLFTVAEGYTESPFGGDAVTLSLNDSTSFDMAKLCDETGLKAVPLQTVENVEAYGNARKSFRYKVFVTDGGFFDYAAVQAVSGRTFTASEVDSRKAVAVISEQAAGELFDGSDPLGQQVKLNNCIYDVVGVFGGTHGFEPGGSVIVPIGSSRVLLGSAGVNRYVFVDVKNSEDVISSVRDCLDGVTQKLSTTQKRLKDYGYTLSDNKSDNASSTLVWAFLYLIMLLLSGVALIMLTAYPSDKSISRELTDKATANIIFTLCIICAAVSIIGCLAGIALGIPGALIFCKVSSIPFAIDAVILIELCLVFAAAILFSFVPGLISSFIYSRRKHIKNIQD